MHTPLHRHTHTRAAIRFGLLARLFGAAAAPVTLFLIATHLSQVEQGLYYTMASLLGLQVVFELGTSVVLTQYFSHEFAHLTLTPSGALEGEAGQVLKVHRMLTTALLLYLLIALAFLVCVGPAGLLFLGKGSGVALSLQLCWLAAALATGLNVLMAPLMALESASGRVHAAARLESVATLASTLLFWLLLLLGAGLWGLVAAPLLRAALYARHFQRTRRALYDQARQLEVPARLHLPLLAEMWPMQWRVALSWLSGYLVFQLFVPVIFLFRGAVDAGKMGMAIAIANTVTAIALVIINTRAAQLGYLVARHAWAELDRTFVQALRYGLVLAGSLAMAITTAAYSLQTFTRFGQRLLDWPQLGLLLAGMVLQVAISHFGVYLRSHKQDPLVWLILLHAALQSLCTVLLARQSGTAGVCLSVLAVNALILPATVYGWQTFRTRWHAQDQDSHSCTPS